MKKTIYSFLLPALLAPMAVSSTEKLDPERLERLERRFGKLATVEESQPANLPELPPEPTEEEEDNSWSLFDRETETVPPQLQRRQAPRMPQSEPDENGWGWLHAEVVAEQQKRAAEQLALDEAERQTPEEDWRSYIMSEEDIQKEVALRLQQEASLLIPKKEPEKINPLKQLPQYKAMGKDYLSPAQKMLSPEYNRERIERLQKEEKVRNQAINRFSTEHQQPSAVSKPYGRSADSIFRELRRSSTLPRSSSIAPQLTQPTSKYPDASQPKTIRDLKKLPSLNERDPFEETFPKARRSIWDD